MTNNDETLKQMAKGFAAFSSPVRLSIFLELVKKGDEGLEIKGLQERLSIPPSTLAHHLRILQDAGVIGQHRKAKHVVCSPDYKRVDELVNYLTENCCIDSNDCCPDSIDSNEVMKGE